MVAYIYELLEMHVFVLLRPLIYVRLTFFSRVNKYVSVGTISVGDSPLERGGRLISVISSNDDQSCSALWLESDYR